MKFMDSESLNYLMKSYKQLSQVEELILINNAKNGCNRSRNKLFNSQIPTIYKMAMKYANSENHCETLIAAGLFAIDDAVRLFDEKLGYRFFTIFRMHLKNQIQITIRKNVLVETTIDYAEKKAYKKWCKDGNDPMMFNFKYPKATSSDIDLQTNLTSNEDLDENEININLIFKDFSPKDKKIAIDYFINKDSLEIIAAQFNCSKQNINQKLKQIKEKLKNNSIVKELVS